MEAVCFLDSGSRMEIPPFLRWSSSADLLVIEIARKLRGCEDQERLTRLVAEVRKLHETLIRGKEEEDKAGFSREDVDAIRLYQAWLRGNRSDPILYERGIVRVIEMLDRFDQLDPASLKWLELYLSAVAVMLSKF
jgi:hypothetical protein